MGVLSVLGVAAPFLGSETERAMEKCNFGSPDGTTTDVVGWSWWPYGTKCRLITADGRTFDEVVPPWRGEPEWNVPGE